MARWRVDGSTCMVLDAAMVAGGTALGASLTCCTTFHPVQDRAINNTAAMTAAVLLGLRMERFSVGINAGCGGLFSVLKRRQKS